MQIEVGKYYKTRDGRKVGPMERTPENDSFNKCYVWTSGWRGSRTPAAKLFCENGRYWESAAKSDNDLIAPWLESPTTGTLAELGVKPGDVVEWVSANETFYFAGEHEGKLHTIQDDGRVLLNSGDGSYWGYLGDTDDFVNWRIVSRASDLSKLDYTQISVERPIYETEAVTRPLEHFKSGPVITETVTRIVPGVYGKVVVASGNNEHAAISIGSERGPEWMSRAELIAARDILSQLIDAMPQE